MRMVNYCMRKDNILSEKRSYGMIAFRKGAFVSLFHGKRTAAEDSVTARCGFVYHTFSEFGLFSLSFLAVYARTDGNAGADRHKSEPHNHMAAVPGLRK